MHMQAHFLPMQRRPKILLLSGSGADAGCVLCLRAGKSHRRSRIGRPP